MWLALDLSCRALMDAGRTRGNPEAPSPLSLANGLGHCPHMATGPRRSEDLAYATLCHRGPLASATGHCFGNSPRMALGLPMSDDVADATLRGKSRGHRGQGLALDLGCRALMDAGGTRGSQRPLRRSHRPLDSAIALTWPRAFRCPRTQPTRPSEAEPQALNARRKPWASAGTCSRMYPSTHEPTASHGPGHTDF